MNRYTRIVYGAIICALVLNSTAQAMACNERVSGKSLNEAVAHAVPCRLKKSTIALCALGAIWVAKSIYDLCYTLPYLDAEIIRLAQRPVKTAAEGLPYLFAVSERALTRSFILAGLVLVPATAVAYYVTYRLENAQGKKHACGAQK